jgi:hypothetical protein
MTSRDDTLLGLILYFCVVSYNTVHLSDCANRLYTKSPNPGEPLWLGGKVVKNEKINEIERTRVCSPPRATSLKKVAPSCRPAWVVAMLTDSEEEEALCPWDLYLLV